MLRLTTLLPQGHERQTKVFLPWCKCDLGLVHKDGQSLVDEQLTVWVSCKGHWHFTWLGNKPVCWAYSVSTSCWLWKRPRTNHNTTCCGVVTGWFSPGNVTVTEISPVPCTGRELISNDMYWPGWILSVAQVGHQWIASSIEWWGQTNWTFAGLRWGNTPIDLSWRKGHLEWSKFVTALGSALLVSSPIFRLLTSLTHTHKYLCALPYPIAVLTRMGVQWHRSLQRYPRPVKSLRHFVSLLLDFFLALLDQSPLEDVNFLGFVVSFSWDGSSSLNSCGTMSTISKENVL